MIISAHSIIADLFSGTSDDRAGFLKQGVKSYFH